MATAAEEKTRGPLRDVVRHTAIYGSGYVTLALASSLLVPIYTHRLTPSEFGVLSLMLVLYGLMSQVYDFGVTNSVARFFFDTPAAERDTGLRDLRATALAFMVVFGGLLSLGLWVSASSWSQLLTQSSSNADLVRIVTVTLYAEALAIVPLTMIRMQERSRLFIVITLARFSATLGLTILFVVGFGWGVRGALLGNAASGLAVLLVLLPELTAGMRGRPSWVLLRRMLAFGLPFFPVILSTWFIEASDRYLLSIYKGHAQVGYYVLGYKVAQIMSIAVAAFVMGWAPLRYKFHERPDAQEQYRRITSYYVVAAGVLTVAVAVFARQIVALIAPPSYAPAASIVPLIVFAYALYGLYVLMVTGMGIAKKTGAMAWVVGGAALVNIGLNVLLMPRWGMHAAAVTTVIAYGLMVAGGWYYSQQVYPIEYEWSTMFRVTGAGVVIVAVTVLLAPSSGVPGIVAAAAACVAFVVVLIKIGAISSEDVSMLRAGVAAAVARWRPRDIEPGQRPLTPQIPVLAGAVTAFGDPAVRGPSRAEVTSAQAPEADSSVSLRQFPYPFNAALSICNDADLLTAASFRRLYRFLATDAETEWGPGLSLPIAGSFFMFRSPDSPNRFTVCDSLSSSLSRDGEFILECARRGILDVLHTYGCFTKASHFSRALAETALDVLREHDVRIEAWVNHGGPTNVQCIGTKDAWQGDLIGTPGYHSDLTIGYGIKWLWTGLETTDCIALDASNRPDGRPAMRPRQMIARVGRRSARSPSLVEEYTLRDGHQARRFFRYSGQRGRTPVLDDLPHQLSSSNLDTLVRAGGYAVVYQHLGVRRVGPGFGPKAYGPVDDEWLFPAELAALRGLSRRYHEGELWVAPTTRLLRYHDVRHRLRWSARHEAGLDVVTIDTRGPGEAGQAPAHPELAGLTFYCDAPEKAHIVVRTTEGIQRLSHVQTNPPDGTGRPSITIQSVENEPSLP